MHLDTFVGSALLLLIAASVAVALFRQIGLGSVLGLLVAGVIVGPHSPGPYVTAEVDYVRHFTELGVVLLLFVIGLEMKPSRLWSLRRQLFGLGTLQILLTGAVIAVYVYLGTEHWPTALLFGLTLALSSTAFVMQLLAERGELASRFGTGAFAILLMQDLAVVPLLAIVPLMSDSAAISQASSLPQQLTILAVAFGVLLLFGLRVVPFALNWLASHGNREAFLLVVLLAVFLAAWAMHQSGLSMALGAFIMGMLLSVSRFNMQIRALVEPYKGLLMSLFFVAVGMSIDLGELAAHPLAFFTHTFTLIVIKLLVLFPLALAFGYRRGDAVRITFLLAQAGEFGFVLFGSALVLNVIDQSMFVMAVGVISLTMLLTPLLVRVGNALASRLERDTVDAGGRLGELPHTDGKVIIGGYGRMGRAVAKLMEASEIPYLAFDTNTSQVARGREAKHAVLYGDISDPALLTATHIERARLLVLTIDSAATTQRTVALLRGSYPDLPIVARARDLDASSKLLDAGATQVYPEAIEASLRLGAMALEMAGASADSVERLVQTIRERDYQLVREDSSER